MHAGFMFSIVPSTKQYDECPNNTVGMLFIIFVIHAQSMYKQNEKTTDDYNTK